VIETGVIVGVCLLGALAFYLDGKLTHNAAKEHLKEKQKILENLKISEDQNESHMTLNEQLVQLQQLDAMTRNHLSNIDQILGAMEQCMVKDTKMAGIQMDSSGVSFSMTLPNKRAAAKMLEQLNQFFIGYEISGLSESAEDGQIPVVNINVKCVFEKEAEETVETEGSDGGGEE